MRYKNVFFMGARPMYSPIPAARVLFFLVFVALCQAYFIDDGNSTVQYYGNSTHFGGGAWVHDATEDKTQYYNGTDSECFCLTSEDCGLTIPFTGSGITVYNVVFSGVNATFTIDGGSPLRYIHDGSCVFDTHPGCLNLSVYDMQSLPYDNHVLEIKVFSYNDTYGDFDFDYAIVNVPTSGAATVTSSAPSSTIPAKHPSHKPVVAAAVGGVFAGLAALSAVVLALLYLRRRNDSQMSLTDINHQPKENAVLALRVDPLLPPQPTISSDLSSANPPPETHETTGAPPLSTSSKKHLHIPAIRLSTAPSTQDSAPNNVPVATEATMHTSAFTGHSLNAVQVDSLHSLLRQNIPGPVVASVMESMLGGDTGDRPSLRVSIDANEDAPSEASPPAYERSPSREGSSLIS